MPAGSIAVRASMALVFLSCSAVSSSDPPDLAPPPPGVPQTAAVIRFDPIDELSTPFSLIPDRRRLVIRETETWYSLWNDLHGHLVPTPDPPAVDFGRQLVLVATMGQRSTGGYAVHIEEIYEDGGTLFPVVVETSPGPLCASPQVMTAPAAAVLLDRAGVEVTFVEQTRTVDCG